MKTRHKIITTTIASLHCMFYPIWFFPIIINAETYFYGTKFSGESAIIINFTFGIIGILLGVFILKQKKVAYFGGIVLFVLVVSDVLTNYSFN